MKERESSGFKITPELVEDSFSHLGKSQVEEDAFIDSCLKEMELKQPYLDAYLKKAVIKSGVGNENNGMMFRFGAAWAYTMIPTNHREELLTIDHINSTHASIVENSSRIEDIDSRQGMALVNLSGFVDKIGEESPAFCEWLADAVEAVEDRQGKAQFMFSALLVVMPFYMRAEARRLEKDLFKGS